MGLHFRRRANTKDQATKSLMKSGVYRLSDESEEKEKPKRSWLLSSSSDDPFNYWSAVKYGSVLMFLLWWIPIFGPMIAGYVAGRRAGTPLKGVFAVSIPLAIVFFVATLVTIKIIPTVWFGVDLAPDAIFGALAKAMPVFGPFANFTTGYLESFIGTIQSSAGVRLDFYILAIAFAYIGGAMALQSLREMEYVVKHGGDHGMHVHVGDPKSKGKKGLWIFGKHEGKAKARDADEEEDEPRRAPSIHFNDMKESSGANRSFSHTPARSRTMEKAMEEDDEEEPIRKRRQKEFERNLNKAKHDVPSKGAHAQHKKLDTTKKSESDDFRFV
ncbi:MAG: MFS transporter [Methanomassiliicoccales archaeon]|jgi:hypothetical protein